MKKKLKNLPSGGTNDATLSASYRPKFTHWWKVTSSTASFKPNFTSGMPERKAFIVTTPLTCGSFFFFFRVSFSCSTAKRVRLSSSSLNSKTTHVGPQHRSTDPDKRRHLLGNVQKHLVPLVLEPVAPPSHGSGHLQRRCCGRGLSLDAGGRGDEALLEDEGLEGVGVRDLFVGRRGKRRERKKNKKKGGKRVKSFSPFSGLSTRRRKKNRKLDPKKKEEQKNRKLFSSRTWGHPWSATSSSSSYTSTKLERMAASENSPPK